jgi:hypothetical protein
MVAQGRRRRVPGEMDTIGLKLPAYEKKGEPGEGVR